MSNDLLFSVLPREGKSPIEKDELRVKRVEKEAKLRALNDEEKELNAEERDTREKYQKKPQQQAQDKQEENDDAAKEDDPELPSVDKHGRKHLDIYI